MRTVQKTVRKSPSTLRRPKQGQVRFLPYEHFSQFPSGHVDKNSTVYVYKNEIFALIKFIFNLFENHFLWIIKFIENTESRPPKCIKSYKKLFRKPKM